MEATRRKRRLLPNETILPLIEPNKDVLLQDINNGVKILKRMTKTVLDENEEAIFGRYVAAVLKNLPLEKRNRKRMQIFSLLHDSTTQETAVGKLITDVKEDLDERFEGH